MPKNPELDLAWDFVEKTDRSIFLTGKAGTGKTTFLHSLKSNSLKRLIVVAPTGSKLQSGAPTNAARGIITSASFIKGFIVLF